MASPKAIATGLGLLHESYPTRDVTEKTGEAWRILFADIEDGAFLSACTALAVERGRTFFPTPGELMALANPAPPPADVEGILAQIHDLGEYGPTGWRYPRLETIREALGEAVASAYSEAGGGRCFANADASGQSVSRDIARREFASALRREANRPAQKALPAPSQKLLR